MDINILSYMPMSVHWGLTFGYETALMVVLLLEMLRINIITQYWPLLPSYHSMESYNTRYNKELLFSLVSFVAFYCFVDSPGDFFNCLPSVDWSKVQKRRWWQVRD